jgi:hypothetical protein
MGKNVDVQTFLFALENLYLITFCSLKTQESDGYKD